MQVVHAIIIITHYWAYYYRKNMKIEHDQWIINMDMKTKLHASPRQKIHISMIHIKEIRRSKKVSFPKLIKTENILMDLIKIIKPYNTNYFHQMIQQTIIQNQQWMLLPQFFFVLSSNLSPFSIVRKLCEHGIIDSTTSFGSFSFVAKYNLWSGNINKFYICQ